MQPITEEMKIHEEWYKEAQNMTLDALPDFLNKLMNEYRHDYGTICHALTAGSLAAIRAMDHHEQGGITGFQAGCIMWQFIRRWIYSDNKTGMRIIDFDNFLYPQYEDKFQKFISADTWAAIRKEAAAKIKEAEEEHEKYLKDLDIYNDALEAFVKKYPDYRENPDKYERLSSGDAEKKKEESGFEFAPRMPYDGPYCNSVYRHWQSIVDGVVPFGYMVKEES